MNIYHTELLKIAASLEATNPLVAYRLEAQVSALASAPVKSHLHKFAADPSIDKFKAQVKSLVEQMTEVKNELETSLSQEDNAFIEFFDNPIGQKELIKAFEETEKLLKTASFVVKTASTQRGKRVANFAEFFQTVKSDLLGGGSQGAEADEFFAGADDVLKQLEEVRKNPDKELVQGIVAQLEAFIQQGNDLLNAAVEFDDSAVNPEGKGITLEGEEEVNPDGIEIDFSEDEGPTDVKATPELEGYELEKIVQHYVDVLQKALKEQDHAGINKFLKELFAETKANVEEDMAKVAARRLARARLLPVLVRFAYARPHLRPVLLPVLRVAAGRSKTALGLGDVARRPIEVIKVLRGGFEELRGNFLSDQMEDAEEALLEVMGEADSADAYIKVNGKRVASRSLDIVL